MPQSSASPVSVTRHAAPITLDMASTQEAPYKAIAARKQAERAAKIPKQWQLPDSILPRDPPAPKDGPQNVMNVPSQFLSSTELRITETHDVASLLSAISTKKFTAVQVAEAFCHRAAIAQQLTNCLTEPLFDSARQRAVELDKHLVETGTLVGPLHGLPVSIKDGFRVRGVDTSLGIASLCFKPAEFNSPLVDLLLSLGCVIVAKTNIPQTLQSLDSINNVFGRVMNPVNRLLTAGGSSGGEGVLVAMRGSMVGFGTDVGGSIRVPAMCNGLYGLKPSVGRLPYVGQEIPAPQGMSRLGVQAVSGPLTRTVKDMNHVMRELVPKAKLFGEDCFASCWDNSETRPRVGSGEKGELVVGIMRGDGNCELLPPIRNVIEEVAARLKQTPGVRVVELGTPPAWTKSQGVMNKLMGIEGGEFVFNMLEATGEPLVPWLATRIRKGKPQTLTRVAEFQAQRNEIERQMLKLWVEEDGLGRRHRKLDAILCPLAAHPVPEIERYNSTGYTSSFVLLDMPAVAMPIRDIQESDLELGKNTLSSNPIGSWDKKNRELWTEDKTDRKVYLGSKLSVQLVVPRGEEQSLMDAMEIVDNAMQGSTAPKARL